METSAVGTTSQASPIANGFANLDSSEFIRVLITELRHQDPFNPQDSAALMEQLSSLRNIESQTLLGDQLKSLVRQNQMASAGNMIGKLVQGIDTQNKEVVGLVLAVRVNDEGVFLELDNGSAMNMNNIIGITNAPQEVTG